LSNDARRHQMSEVLALVQEQMADIVAVQKKQAELTATGAAADGMVEVTVDARGQLVKTVIDESYLEEHEFEELGDHITEAAQAAARDASRRVAAMMVPISERRKAFPSLSEIVEGAPDLRDLTPAWLDPFAAARSQRSPDDDDGSDETPFPTVRR
jgi:DNA-binding protein YbaB